ncbi:MAG: SprT-like domain-containing protein [Acidobacteriota bacterium]
MHKLTHVAGKLGVFSKVLAPARDGFDARLNWPIRWLGQTLRDMAQNTLQLQRVFGEAFRQLDPKGRRFRLDDAAIEVRFYPYAGLHHTIRVRSGRVYVRLSDVFESAPPDVMHALAFLLVARLLSRKAPAAHEKTYRAYAYSPNVLRASDIARQKRGRKVFSSARGKVYDLTELFERINRRYFDGEIEKPVLTWSKRRAKRILGHHDAVHNTITISKALDARDVPEWFVEYILYHEMLHIKHPAKLINGRRYYHTPAFRSEEQRFPRYQASQEWLDRVVRKQHELRARAA